MDFLATLNPRQQEAVLHTEGPLLILAGAGSGKTRVIISRIAHLIRGHGVPPDSILAVTFTNKAAQEMRERVEALLGESGARLPSWPEVSTFHSFCVRLLRSQGTPLARLRPGFTTSFSIYDENDQVAVVKKVFRQTGLDEGFMKPRSVVSILSHAKNQGRTPQDFYRQATSANDERLAVVFDRYQGALAEANALDFDDLLLESVRLLRHDEDVRERVGRRYQYLMIDEYQDTNRPQYELMLLLAGRHKNVCVVGDEDQSIYSWRGADIRNILDFERHFPEAAVIRLEQNYRSTKRILAAAGSVVANNVNRKGKELWSAGGEGEPIFFYQGRDGEQEALFVAGYIDHYLNEHPDRRAAVLYRTNAQSRQVEEALRRYSRDYRVVGTVSFYQRAEVKDLIAYLRLAVSPLDELSLLRVINTPARGIGRTTVEQITQYAESHRVSAWEAIERMLANKDLSARAHAAVDGFRELIEGLRAKVSTEPVHKALVWLMEESGYQQMLEKDGSIEAAGRLENINEFINAAADAAKRGEGVHGFLDHAALVSDTDQIDENAQVLLMTLHSAKGLEFPLVAMIGLEETIFPHSRSLDDPAALEEEGRLCYVGMTRARMDLLLTCARSRRRYGGGAPEPMKPSRFLQEVPRELLRDVSTGRPVAYGGSSRDRAEVDLYAERREAREVENRPEYSGKTYNSVENVASFFAERGIPFPQAGRQAPPGGEMGPGGGHAISPTRPSSKLSRQPAPKGKTPPSGFRLGTKVRHARFGLGTVVRSEGEGKTAKVTVHFQNHGLRKLAVEFAGLQRV